MTKACTKCGETKPLDEFRIKRRVCLSCERQRAKEAMAEHRRLNGERVNARRREVRATDPDRFREQDKRKWEKHGDRINEGRRNISAEERTRRNALRREQRSVDPTKLRAAEQAWREANRETKREQQRAFYARNRDLYALHRRKREARLAEVEYQPYTRTEIFERDGGHCRGCGLQLVNEPNGFQIDHIVPISLGGPDIPANLQLMCAPCNRRKWAALDGQIFLPV